MHNENKKKAAWLQGLALCAFAIMILACTSAKSAVSTSNTERSDRAQITVDSVAAPYQFDMAYSE